MSGLKRKRAGPSQALAIYRAPAVQYKRPRIVGPQRLARSGAGELKFFDRTVDDAVVATAGSVVDSINLIAQGITDITRIGRKCTVKSINWRYRVSLPGVTANAALQVPDSCRVMMFWDKQANGATADASGNDGILTTGAYHAFNNLTNSGRFVILHDKMYTLNPTMASSDAANVHDSGETFVEGTFFKKCNIPLEFSDTAGAITELRSNNIGVLLISASGVMKFDSRTRVRFADS